MNKCIVAADEGSAEAQHFIAGCYYNGSNGVPKDLQKAVHYYWLAAAEGNAKAQSNLAGCYYNGSGVPKHPFVITG